jgi:hypothetical protein
MDHFAFLAPVGPFAGLSNAARQKINERFPALAIGVIESAAESFLRELQAPDIEPRLTEARDELNLLAKEIERFHGALNHVRNHRLDAAIGDASRMISGENELEGLERSLNHVRTAVQRTSRALPSRRSELASRRLVATLARHAKRVGLPVNGAGRDSLLGLVDLIFEDLMVGGDAADAVREWRQGQAAQLDHERTTILLDLAH